MTGPYTLVDADTGVPMRNNRFTHAIEALTWGYRAHGTSLIYGDLDLRKKDFKVLDKHLKPIPRSRIIEEDSQEVA